MSRGTTVPPPIAITRWARQALARLLGARSVAFRAPYSDSTASIDLADTVLPIVESSGFDGRTVQWVEQATGTRDFAVATLTEGSLTRVIAGAGVASSLHVPALPASYGVAFTGQTAIELALGKATGGYDAVRGTLLGGALVDAAPMNGQIARY